MSTNNNTYYSFSCFENNQTKMGNNVYDIYLKNMCIKHLYLGDNYSVLCILSQMQTSKYCIPL